MSGFQTNFVVGFAALLSSAGVGTWRSDGSAYLASETAIFLKVMLSSPDNAICLTAYPISDAPTLADSVIGLQVMTRAAGQDPRMVDDLADLAFDQLQALHDVTLSTGVRVEGEVGRRSSVSLGQDDLKRWGRVDNFHVPVWRPAPNRL